MIRARIAPTPSGYLHIGNALNFVLTWLWTRRSSGQLLLRIDDLDAARVKPEYLNDIFETLHWLGLDWDQGPQTPDEHQQKFSQVLRTGNYNGTLERLITTGKVFACNCSRKEIEGQYQGTCLNKHLPLNTPDTALRITTPENTIITIYDSYGPIEVDLYQTMRHFVIRRRDGIAAYQVASLTDDIDAGINLIIRGADLINSTAAQLYLAGLLGNGSFEQTTFYHHPVVNDAQGFKLSKSAGSTSLKAWRDAGKKPEDFYLWMSAVLGWKEQARSADEMLVLSKHLALRLQQ